MMRRSASNHHDSTNHHSSSNSTEQNHQQHKRSLEDYGFSTNLKRRRHLSPQNTNIDLNHSTDGMSSPAISKKTRTKSKNQSILNSSLLDVSHDDNSISESPITRKSSSRHTSSASSQQLTELTLPSWERICPDIDRILSNKHAQSGVFAHEVQLVQQELEALLSMSIVRETILKEFHHPPTINADNLRSKIRKHQEAERIYSSKKNSKKSSASSHHHHHHSHHRQSQTSGVLDRQVTIAPIIGAKIDRIWSDLNNYFHKIAPNDVTAIENLVEWQTRFENKLQEIQAACLDQSNSIDRLKEFSYEPLHKLAQESAVITNYLDRTTLGSFQAKLYEHIGQTSPVYRTPISSPMHVRPYVSNPDSRDYGASLRISPRLHPNEFHQSKSFPFAFNNVKQEEENDMNTSMKSKTRSKFLASPSSAIKFQQRIQLVQNYLVDQHISCPDTVKRQLFSEGKPTKKRKTSTSLLVTNPNENGNNDSFQTKLSNLISLVHECSSISSTALTRARLQTNHEQVWLKLMNIEREISLLIEKLDTPTALQNPTASIEKAFQNLAQLLNDWQESELEFDEQYKKLFDLDP